MLSFAEVKALFNYNPETGELRWAKSRGFIRAGTLAGGMVNGTMYVRADGERFKAADLAWSIAKGRKPRKRLVHLNGDRSDLRLSNLAEGTRKHRSGPSIEVDAGIKVTPVGYKVVAFTDGQPTVLGVFREYYDACRCLLGGIAAPGGKS